MSQIYKKKEVIHEVRHYTSRVLYSIRMRR
jgi:hypothetical protein